MHLVSCLMVSSSMRILSSTNFRFLSLYFLTFSIRMCANIYLYLYFCFFTSSTFNSSFSSSLFSSSIWFYMYSSALLNASALFFSFSPSSLYLISLLNYSTLFISAYSNIRFILVIPSFSPSIFAYFALFDNFFYLIYSFISFISFWIYFSFLCNTIQSSISLSSMIGEFIIPYSALEWR